MIHPIFDWLIENIESDKLCWYSLSLNPNITWELINKHINKPWIWYLLVKHPNISWKHIKLINKSIINNDIWIGISENPNITWDIIISNPNFLWSWKKLSCHPNITFEIIKDNLNNDWCWKLLSYNPNITWKHILDNPDMTWYYETLIYNENIYWDIINNNETIINFLKTKFDDIDYLFNRLDWLLMSSDKRLNSYSINKINKVCHVTKNQKNNNLDKTNEEIINSFWHKQQISINLDFNELLKINILYNWDYFLLNKNINMEQINYIINNNNNDISFELSQSPLLDINFFNNNNKYFCDLGFMINPNINLDYIKLLNNNPESRDKIYWLCSNKFFYNDYYISNNYKKKLVKEFNDKCLEEIIKISCHPSRIINWNEDILLDYPELLNL